MNIEDVDNIYNKFINEHNRKFEKYTTKCQFNFHFHNYLPGLTSKLFNNTVCDWKGFIMKVISDFNKKGFKFSQISKMHIITHNLKKDMTYFMYMNCPMSAVERKININLNKNPDLINTFDGAIDHPMIRRFSFIPIVV